MVSVAFAACLVGQSTVRVKDYAGLRSALIQARPGTTVLLEPGDYHGGFHFVGPAGSAGNPITIGASNPKNPPRIVGGGLHFVSPSYLFIHDLVIDGGPEGGRGNGINLDDGGDRNRPAHHISLKRITVLNYNSKGGHGIKMAGVDNFRIDECHVKNWDVCGIDLVGCHKGLIENCRIEDGVGVGVQAKGASSEVTVRRCRFTDSGNRGVNMGGSTGDPYFRPPFETIPHGQRYEARNITVEGCTFIRGDSAVAFVNLDGGIVRQNTLYLQNRWAMRILQETNRPDFHPSRKGIFERNIVVFNSVQWFEGGVNIGPNTAPKSFVFEKNFWYCQDQPSRSEPRLPTVEKGGIVGVDPQFINPDEGNFALKSNSPAFFFGALSLGWLSGT